MATLEARFNYGFYNITKNRFISLLPQMELHFILFWSGLISVLLLSSFGLGSPTDIIETPINIFASDPISPYYVWWRPYKINFDLEKVRSIEEIINKIAIEEVKTLDLKELSHFPLKFHK